MADRIESNVPGEQIIRGGEEHYEPVITVTQQETSTTRGNISAQKITITEDISDEGRKKEALDNNKLENGATEVKSVEIGKKDKGKTQHEEKRSKSKIPMLRKAVRQLIQVEDKKKMEEEIPVQRRKSSIPRLKKLAARAEKENTNPKTVVSPRTEEEFDKIFNEIKQNSDRNSNAFIKDPAKLEMKFEEIIHDYDENKVEPINVEKLKTRIPMLKRKSEHDIEATKVNNWRRVYKKRSSIQNPQHYTKLFLKVQSKAGQRNRTQSETNDDDASAPDTERPENIEDKISENTKTDTISLPLLDTNAVKNTKTAVNDQGPSDNSSLQNAQQKKNRIIKKSQSIDSSNKHVKEIKKNNSVKRSLSQNDNLPSNVLVQKAVVDQKPILDSEQCTTTPIPTETTDTEASDVYDINLPVEETIKTISYEIDTFVKQDMVCKETSMLIRKNQEQEDIDVSEEPQSLEIEVSYTITESYPVDKNTPIQITEKPEHAILNKKQDDERDMNTDDEIKETNKNINADINDEKVIDALDQEITEPEHISTDLFKPIICDTETKDTDENDIPSFNVSSEYIDKPDSFIDDESEVHEAPQELFDSTLHTLDSNKYLQVNQSIENGDQQIPIRGHPNALFNRPETPIEDFLPMLRGSRENLSTRSLNIDTPRTEEKNTDTIIIDEENQKLNSPKGITDIEHIQEQRRKNKEKIHELLSNAQEEDIILLKGKVNRVISRLDSRDYSDFKNKHEIIESVPKKSVLSKIALFEQKEAEVNKRKLKNQSQIADLPKVVDEILKQPKSEQNENPFIWKTKCYVEKPRKDFGNIIEPRIEIRRELSYAEADLGDAVKGRVRDMVVRMVSLERMDLEKKGIIDVKEKPRSGSVFEKIAMFEKKVTQPKKIKSESPKHKLSPEVNMSEEELKERVAELRGAKKYGRVTDLKYVELNDGSMMPAIGVGTALLHKSLTKHIVCIAIDFGYRTIDTAFIYGNEKEIGEAIKEKISDGTVKREDLFVISKLWSTFHRRDLVEKACKMSLKAMGLEYFDLYLIHNPTSLKEGDDTIPKIANVIQYSDSDYLDAWFSLEKLVKKGLVKRVGVSNFNSAQIDRILDKGRIKPVINQIECHPYLTQYRLDEFSQSRDVKLSCYGVLGSKGTPLEFKSGLPPVIDDPMVLSMAAGLEVTPAQLLISYQLHLEHSVVVKASTAEHLWSNLQAQYVKLENTHISALNALNRNKRNFTFKCMGDTHRNYPFRIPF